IELYSRNIDTGDFLWTTNFNISFNRNKVVALNEGQDRIGNNVIVGEPIDFIWGVKWAGVNPADGRPMWYDRNGDITYTPQAADQLVISRLEPSHYGGFTNTVSYKGFVLDVFFQYEFGGETLEQQ